MKAIEQVLQALQRLEQKNNKGISAIEISEELNTDRANVSRYLNQLYEEKKVERLEGRPVLFRSKSYIDSPVSIKGPESSFDKIVANQPSLKIPIQQAKAAILYPPKGLHTLLLGETGVGKSMFAELMYQFAKDSQMVKAAAPFIRFNCADYAENPQLLVSHIFGVKKGAYTGADKDREGLITKADGGFLFLDEVHRLPPQGQEMLFTFIDKGSFRLLGDTEVIMSSDVRIIAATTEQPKSFLLNTFTRRIPMIIELPPLRSKELAERYYLIEHFIRLESLRIGKSIYAEKNAIIAFMLYECMNNIGQLKSDIQLTCAKSFVNYKSQKEDSILITTADLPQHVLRGMMHIQEHRDNIEFLLKSKSPTIKFSQDVSTGYSVTEVAQLNVDFYDAIEQKLEELKSSGMKNEDINYAINLDIEEHFKKYLGDIPTRMRSRDLSKLIAPSIMQAAEAVLQLAQQRLQREFDDKLKLGLALHLHGFVERIKRGIRIYHPKLNSIRIDHPEEFMAAMEAAKILDAAFEIHTPLDEIGYIAMFLFFKPMELSRQERSLVGVLVMMHGNSTASSMAEVCRGMIGTEHAAALDMPLNVSPKIMYELAKEKILKLDQGRGVLLLVDMGSLTTFGKMLQDETGILIKTIDMTSTAVVIDVCRKAILGRDIHYIYDSIKIPARSFDEEAQEKYSRKNIIVTACFTGEGASERLKQIVETTINMETLEVIPLNIINKKEFIAKIEKLREEHRILAIVSTVGIEIEGIPFISAADVLAKDGMQDLEAILETEGNYLKVARSLSSHVSIDSEALVWNLREVQRRMEVELKLSLKEEVKIGMLLHMSFLIDKLKKGGKETYFEDLPAFQQEYAKELAIIRGCLKDLENEYKIMIGQQEEAYICKMLIANGEAFV